MSAPYPQTNLQLYAQIVDAGWGDADLALVRASYELVVPLFARRFRGNGKPFLAHLVGTAGILAAVGASPPTVAAGLLHAVYAQGDWSAAGANGRGTQRQLVRAAVGAEVEGLVDGYTKTRWNLSTVTELRSRFDDLDVHTRTVALIRLANVLEDHLDGGLAYSGKGSEPRFSEAQLDVEAELAVLLGHPQLAAELRRAFDETSQLSVPDALRSPDVGSFSVASGSPALARRGSLRRWAQRVRRRGRRR